MPDNAAVPYSIPIPDESPIGARDSEDATSNGSEQRLGDPRRCQ